MQRRYPSSPIAAVAAVLLEGESVLLVKRGNPPNPATWGLPGGAVELGETVRQALQREIKEETGLEIEPISLVAVFDSIHPNGHGQVEYHYVLVEYLCRVVSGVLSPASDIVEARWVQLSQMNLVGIGPATARLILKAADENKVNRTSNSR